MVSRIIMTCGGFALAFLGTIISLHGSSFYGSITTIIGIIIFLSSLERTANDK